MKAEFDLPEHSSISDSDIENTYSLSCRMALEIQLLARGSSHMPLSRNVYQEILPELTCLHGSLKMKRTHIIFVYESTK